MGEDGAEARHDGNLGRDQRRLEEAGWELVEETLQITLWRNPESGRLYPQRAAIGLVSEGQAPDYASEA
jgi:hypothetical protein